MSLARIVSLSFAFALVVVLSGGAASLYGIQRLGQTEAWVVRATETLEQLGSIRGLAVAEQSGSRGFALTGRNGPDREVWPEQPYRETWGTFAA